MKKIQTMIKAMVLSATLMAGVFFPNKTNALETEPSVKCFCNADKECVANGDGRTQCNKSAKCWEYDSKCSEAPEA